MKGNNNRAKIALIALLCLFFNFKSYAQVKKTLTIADYALWKTSPNIISAESSGDGSWYVYKTGNDTTVNICLKNIKKGLEHHLNASNTPNQLSGYSNEPKTDFSKDNKYYAFLSKDTLCFIELNSGKINSIPGITGFQFVGDGKYLLGKGNLNKDKKVWLRDLKSQTTISVDHVEQFGIAPTRHAMVANLIKDGLRTVIVISFKPGFPVSVITSSTKHNFEQLTWNKTGTVLAFYETKGTKEQGTIFKVHTCSNYLKHPKLISFEPKDNRNLPKNYSLRSKDPLYLSADGKQLFFFLTKNEALKPKSNLTNKYGIEVWLPTDLRLPSGREIPKYENQLWYQWLLEDNTIMPVTDDKYTSVVLTGNEQTALIYNKTDYLPKYKYKNDFADFYIKDLKTGKSKLLLERIWEQPSYVLVSPGGKYVAYYKEKNWWVYDINQDIHRCLTQGFKTILEDIDEERVASVPPFGSPGWFKDDSQLIIYDQHDIWLLSPDGKKRLRITNGAEIDKTFRLAKLGYPERSPGPGDSWFKFNKSYDEAEGLVITSLNNDNLDNGLLIWTPKSGLTKLVEKPMKLKLYDKIWPNKPFLFSESSFEVPPRLMLYLPTGKTELLYQTDPHQNDYKWGRSELVHYTTPDGKKLKGALYYPADFVPGKHYPMVVNIYEKMSKFLHEYEIPSLGDNRILNITNYTTNGYLVFCPDISYEPNDPGISATKCVVSGVEKVIDMGLADRHNIGLIGHSFGGYETAFIATQTDLFKTAIASAGITDISSWAILYSLYGPNFERVEEDQFRMTEKFMGDDYKRNSPMTYVHQMKTPILLWSGDKDSNVDVSQTKSFHTALWRLGKQSTMLIYKGEDHVLGNPNNQIDMTRRTKNWFDHYLKGEKPADWMSGNTK